MPETEDTAPEPSWPQPHGPTGWGAEPGPAALSAHPAWPSPPPSWGAGAGTAVGAGAAAGAGTTHPPDQWPWSPESGRAPLGAAPASPPPAGAGPAAPVGAGLAGGLPPGSFTPAPPPPPGPLRRRPGASLPAPALGAGPGGGRHRGRRCRRRDHPGGDRPVHPRIYRLLTAADRRLQGPVGTGRASTSAPSPPASSRPQSTSRPMGRTVRTRVRGWSSPPPARC